MKKYILKEYGSWSVMAISYLAGLLASGVISYKAAVAFFALSLFINSKQAFTLWIRRVTSPPIVNPVKSLAVFIVQIISASLMLVIILGVDTVRLLPYALVPITYILLFYFIGEHAIVTEIAGFALLTLSSLIAKFVITGAIDPKLYLAVAVFFIAGVFKVKLQLKRRPLERVLMILYLVLALSVYYLIEMPALILLPLTDNLLFSATLYRVKLKTAGWIELIKSILFVLFIAFYSASII